MPGSPVPPSAPWEWPVSLATLPDTTQPQHRHTGTQMAVTRAPSQNGTTQALAWPLHLHPGWPGGGTAAHGDTGRPCDSARELERPAALTEVGLLWGKRNPAWRQHADPHAAPCTAGRRQMHSTNRTFFLPSEGMCWGWPSEQALLMGSLGWGREVLVSADDRVPSPGTLLQGRGIRVEARATASPDEGVDALH